MNIETISARQILDSRGNPTVEVEASTKQFTAIAGVPSGASTGAHEAVELRDGGSAYGGKGVLKAVGNVSKIYELIKGRELNQRDLDLAMNTLDGTPNKENLGANAILGVSMAVAKLIAQEKKISLYKSLEGGNLLPMPFFNVLNGGKHAGNKLAVQEFMIAPKAETFQEALRMGSETYHILKKLLEEKYGKESTNVGDEGGFAPNISTTKEGLDLLQEAIQKSGYEGRIKIAMDAAASEFFEDGNYLIDGKSLSAEELQKYYENLVLEYPIISIEDPFHEDDFEAFSKLTSSIGKDVQIVGDDLLVTNVERIKQAKDVEACNALLLKVNQIGTVSEAIDAAKLAKSYGWNVMVSHRSGETTDTFIADLCVGLATGQIKSGAPCRGERLAKYNRLLQIEEELSRSS